jgi:hypothetical protein
MTIGIVPSDCFVMSAVEVIPRRCSAVSLTVYSCSAAQQLACTPFSTEETFESNRQRDVESQIAGGSELD